MYTSIFAVVAITFLAPPVVPVEMGSCTVDTKPQLQNTVCDTSDIQEQDCLHTVKLTVALLQVNDVAVISLPLLQADLTT